HDIPRAAVDAVAGPGGGAQQVDVEHGRAVARLARQRPEDIALRQVVRAAVGVARTLVGAEAGEIAGADDVASQDGPRHVRSVAADDLDHAVGETPLEILVPSAVPHLDPAGRVAARLAGDLQDLHPGHRLAP